jgi:tetratricopeptide (TPR) repeat protein
MPFNHEGLATCFMESVDGKAIDFHALVHVLADAYYPQFMRVPNQVFAHADKPNFYIAAGSFTGFLIRTFGWETYAQFFRQANENNYETHFEKAFGMGMLVAERRWRFELLQTRKGLEPALSQAVAEHRVASAYNSWQLYRCLEEVERIGRAGPVSAKALWFASAAHRILGHYSDAAEIIKQLLEMNDEWAKKYRGGLWMDLGTLHDLLGQREAALEAYEKVLAEPEYSVNHQGSHVLARGYMKQAYTERQLIEQYKYWVR